MKFCYNEIYKKFQNDTYVCTCKNPKTRQNCHSYFARKLVNFFCTTDISSDFSVNP